MEQNATRRILRFRISSLAEASENESDRERVAESVQYLRLAGDAIRMGRKTGRMAEVSGALAFLDSIPFEFPGKPQIEAAMRQIDLKNRFVRIDPIH